MIPSDPHRFPDDLQDVAELLRGNRPEATPLELDGVYRQVRTRVRKGQNSMKSRFAMMAMLVVGLLMSGTGATLAVSGGTNDASVAQYDEIPCDRNGDGVVDGNEDLNGSAPGCDDSGVLPATAKGTPTCDENGDGVISPSEAAKNDCGGVKGETDKSPQAKSDAAPATSREQGAQPSRQVAAGGGSDELPFTGFAAIPILVGGIALTGGGLVLRRRTAA
jgi:hypothetical protein